MPFLNDFNDARNSDCYRSAIHRFLLFFAATLAVVSISHGAIVIPVWFAVAWACGAFSAAGVEPPDGSRKRHGQRQAGRRC